MVGRVVGAFRVTFDVHVEIRGIEGVADPEGQTIERALPALGFGAVTNLHVGKIVRFQLDATDEDSARRVAKEMCERLLANPVIERFEVTIQHSDLRRGVGGA
jgi:phosphoribosylformylglycinamidine synthase